MTIGLNFRIRPFRKQYSDGDPERAQGYGNKRPFLPKRMYAVLNEACAKKITSHKKYDPREHFNCLPPPSFFAVARFVSN